MQTIYAVQQYTFEDWNVYKWFDTIDQANQLHTQLCNQYPDHKCYFKIIDIANDVKGNNFRHFNITINNKG